MPAPSSYARSVGRFSGGGGRGVRRRGSHSPDPVGDSNPDGPRGLCVNVGGSKHFVPRELLEAHPDSRLGRLAARSSSHSGVTFGDPLDRSAVTAAGGPEAVAPEGPADGAVLGSAAFVDLCDDADPSSREFFFDRSAETFGYVLAFYRTGRLHVHEGLCAAAFLQEMEYWGISEPSLARCCRDRFGRKRDTILSTAAAQQQQQQQQFPTEEFGSKQQAQEDEERQLLLTEGARCGPLRVRVLELLESPESSRTARAVSLLSVSFVLLSVVNMCLMTAYEGAAAQEAFAALESACTAWFTVEFSCRAACAPRKLRFLARFSNVVDLLAIAPYYITALIERVQQQQQQHNSGAAAAAADASGGGGGGGGDLGNAGRALQTVRLLRALRLLKLGRHSTGLRALGTTLARCYEEVGMLMLFLSVGISIFAALEHALEGSEPNSLYPSVPAAWWWAIASMTTVGYGDIRPDTAAGKAVAFLCILFGILVLALPIATINDKFSEYYVTLRARDSSARQGKTLRRLARSLSQERLAAAAAAATVAGAGGDGGRNLRDAYARRVVRLLRGSGGGGGGGAAGAQDT
ncbi:potassium voltage-gated channel subfamily V member 1 isoform X2 [Petromyzon marinus]|uniref:Potassium voltage-gated channel subfamily V member 1-like n=1 Tax=Petromyzon marinus TaxID=7757 RepID=A0AAJ7SZR2_PETMA|nr:potassium voltage-gated channel subfamily V member 1-like [Petromyzon marinus]XP_032808587.1 potassium voltage-gated channel subfamily V member 1-like [Petromyzon marinus]